MMWRDRWVTWQRQDSDPHDITRGWSLRRRWARPRRAAGSRGTARDDCDRHCWV